MGKSLYQRLALVLLLIFLILGALLFWFYEKNNQTLQRELSQQLRLNLAAYLVQDIRLFESGELEHDNVKEAFSKVMMLDPSTELYVISLEGKVIAYDAPKEKIQREYISLEPLRTFLNHKDALPILGDDPRSDKQKIFSAAEIFDDEKQRLAYLYIIINGEIYDNIVTALKFNKTWRLGLIMIAMALLFLLLSALLLFYTFTRPLVHLRKEVAAFEASGFTHLPSAAQTLLAANKPTSDELKSLQGSFYRMGQHIIDQLAYLKQHDRLRREFLAHVSHDLRTPLAGMRAYLETLQLESDVLAEKDRQVFLEKALLTHTRLSKMINELFELARLEHGEVDLKLENVMISDLLSDLYASLGGLAKQKGVQLNVTLSDNGLSVQADLARLDRVLQNLVVNAIHYTPTGGKVTVSVKPAAPSSDKIAISIYDTGQGIAADELPYIFEPYFRADDGKKVYAQGKGLGLAISQRLLLLHGSALVVKSVLNHGTVFRFQLDKS